ncbi:integrin beta-like protein E [Ylistrum balloti]|uniref:integrin beta-like protein E n=1 Tax=Ylistrum balloti TaxID=509963 RepID=UPI002905D565|nr:integrin beta-like protein E [Ylistrum balloti]
MDQTMSVVRVALLTSIVISCCHGAFLGGSINWYMLGGKVRFTYRLTWEKGTGPCGPGCSQASVGQSGTLSLPLTILSWSCTSGCNGNSKLHDANYVTTSVGAGASSWEQGEGSFLFTPPKANGKYEIMLSPLRWSTQANGPGQLQTTVDLRIRSDTNLPNASPIAAVQPSIGVPSGCRKTIALPVVDPDADITKCRLAGPTECGMACTTLTGIHIDNDKCTVTVPDTLTKGEYRLAVVVEDFPRSIIQLGGATSNLNKPLSVVPIQLTIHVIQTSGGCGSVIPSNADTGPTITYPSSGAPTGSLHTVLISAQSNAQAIVSTSAGVKTTQSPDPSHPGNFRVNTSWTPNADQDGMAFTCVWALQNNGITTDHKCFTTIVRDKNDCSGGNKCLHGSTCIDLYKRYTCNCLGGFTSKDCSVRASCVTSNPCVNGTCEERHGTLFCICSQGYTGKTCDTTIDNCALSPCLHGGTCIAKATGSSCTCTVQFTGSQCQTRIQTPLHSRSVTASLLYKATISSDSDGSVQILDYVKVSDQSKKDINVVVNNDSPPLWPIGVAFGGCLLIALTGCVTWWCCFGKRGPNKGFIEPQPAEKWARPRRSGNAQNRSSGSPVAENTPRKSGNNVTQVETNTGTQVSGGSPRILNIYQSSANDPNLHKCGSNSRGNVHYNNTFW